MTARDLATRLVAFRVLTDIIKQADRQTRDELGLLMLDGDREAAAVHGPDGWVPIGTVTRTKGKAGSVTASVVDPDALLRWCRKHRPGAVSECVRTSDQAAILAEVKQHGGILDPLTGTIDEVPGVIVTEGSPGEPGCMVKPNAQAEEIIRAAFADGSLRMNELTQ